MPTAPQHHFAACSLHNPARAHLLSTFHRYHYALRALWVQEEQQRQEKQQLSSKADVLPELSQFSALLEIRSLVL